jgi:deazaflavin-dependent oxidoreductase (nitroreductase family)
VPNDFQLKAMNAVHRFVRKVSAERLGWTVTGMRVLELTTVGRKSGRPHAVMLTSPIELNGRLVVVASRGGDDHHPAWFLNLRDHPAVQVRTSGRLSTPMFARVATAEERAQLWPEIIAGHRNYAAYQSKTSREIPLVVLEPAPAEG